MTEPFFQIKTIYGVEGEHRLPYMTRVIVGRLRLHIFHRGDNDPDPHDHPWDFWTFPLTSYVEEVTAPHWIDGDPVTEMHIVQAFRLHYRPAEYTHRVLGRYVPGLMPNHIGAAPGPIVTIVWRSKAKREWGFLKNRDGQWCWVGWRNYIFEGGKHAPCEEDRDD